MAAAVPTGTAAATAPTMGGGAKEAVDDVRAGVAGDYGSAPGGRAQAGSAPGGYALARPAAAAARGGVPQPGQQLPWLGGYATSHGGGLPSHA